VVNIIFVHGPQVELSVFLFQQNIICCYWVVQMKTVCLNNILIEQL